MSGIARRLRVRFGFMALLAGIACAGAGAVALWQARMQNAQVSSLTTQGLHLIAQGNLDAAQALADRMTTQDGGRSRADFLYALGNARLRRGLTLLKTVPYRQAAPMLSQARAAYREVLRLDPDNWDARYNYALVAPLLRDKEAAQASFGDQMAHGRAAWPDIPGAPNGMP